MHETLSNIVKLIQQGILTATALAQYVYYQLHDGEPTPTKQVHLDLGLSTTIIYHNNKILEQLGIVDFSYTSQTGRRTKVPHVNELSREQVKDIVRDTRLVGDIKKYRDAKINKYHLKSFNTNNINIKKPGTDKSVKLLMHYLPEEHRAFRVTPKQLESLHTFSKTYDLRLYTKWFIKYKLGITVHKFSLGIFLYGGIVQEYNIVKRKFEKTQNYKTVSSRNKKTFAEAAKNLEKEFS